MASPRVFISSTWYDLRYIRENLKYFVRSLGYEPVLSEEGSVYFDPRRSAPEACLAEVPNCQMFVLIIGGRYGSAMPTTPTSVTNAEYREAVRLKIPVFALVEQSVHSDQRVYAANRGSDAIDRTRIAYPSSDSTAIFEFIEEVRGNAVNNALVAFRDFGDIEAYLKQQWAGMVHSFLTARNENERVADTLDMLRGVSERVEMLSRQILRSVGTTEAKVATAMYDAMLTSEAVKDLTFLGCRPTPRHILEAADFASCLAKFKKELEIEDSKEFSVSGGGTISRPRYDANVRGYAKLRAQLERILNEHDLSVSQYLAQGTEA